MRKDQLFEIFKKQLVLIDPEKQTLADLVYEVVGEYMAHLLENGNIPHHMLDQVEADLKEEVVDMFLKTNYGSLKLTDSIATAKLKALKNRAS